jgi:hypothetical protein
LHRSSLAKHKNKTAIHFVAEPEHEAIQHVTYQELYVRVNEMAALLRDIDIAAFAHTLAESVQHGGRRRRNREHSNAGLLNRLGRLLGAHREWPRDRRAAKQGDELAPSHLLLQSQENLAG